MAQLKSNINYIYIYIEVTGRRGRRRRKLLDDLKERRGYSHLKKEALNCPMWTAGFGKCFEPVVRQTAKLIYIYIYLYIYIYIYIHSESPVPVAARSKA